ncbi:hypothetical protein ACS0TY_004807 [Phlomoides rotata]
MINYVIFTSKYRPSPPPASALQGTFITYYNVSFQNYIMSSSCYDIHFYVKIFFHHMHAYTIN